MTNSQLWFRGVRPSKFRHVYGLPSRKECCYTDINNVRNGNDGNICALNPTFLAIVSDTAFVVIPIQQTGRVDFQCCKVTGHSGQILDLKWNPFDDNQIASASDDCSIRIWDIPENGLTSNMGESTMELLGHKRKVMIIVWHPIANNILISAGYDNSIIIWNVEDGKMLNVINCHNEMIYCMDINQDGTFLATTSKDKKLKIIELRDGIVISEGVCHSSAKCSKVAFLDYGRVVTTGFSRHSDRQYAIWDQHNLKNPLAQEVIDSSSGIVTPYYDSDTKMLYLAGKGDGNIRYYEIVEEAPYIYYLHQFLSGQPQKALGVMPKRGVNTQQCEIFRFYKIHATGSLCEPISMVVPRKSTLFQTDLYPDTIANIPAVSGIEWFQGRNAKPILMSMETKDQLIGHKESMKKSYEEKPQITSTQTNGLKSSDNKILDNNSKKFAFLAQQTVPDYRPQPTQINDKNQKTTTNQSTKFQQLQAIFGNQGANNKEIANIQNNLISSHNSSQNNSIENLSITKTENELRKVILQQGEEIKNLRNHLTTAEEKIHELEKELKSYRKIKH